MKAIILSILTLIIITQTSFAQDPYKGMTSEDFKNHPDFEYIESRLSFTGASNPTTLKDGRIVFSASIGYFGLKPRGDSLWVLNPDHPDREARMIYSSPGEKSGNGADDPTELKDGRILYRTYNSKLWTIDPDNPKDRKQFSTREATEPLALQNGKILYIVKSGGNGKHLYGHALKIHQGSLLTNVDCISKEVKYDVWKDGRFYDYVTYYGYTNVFNPTQLSNGKIVYSSDQNKDSRFELYMLDLNSKKKTRLTRYYDTHHEITAYHPLELKDGRILYSADRTSMNDYELWAFDFKNPKEKTRLTRYNETHSNVDAYESALLKDGRIVFRTDRSKDGRWELWILEPDTGVSYPLTSYKGGFFKKRFTSFNHFSKVLPTTKSDFFNSLYSTKKTLNPLHDFKLAISKKGTLFDLYQESHRVCDFMSEHPNFSYLKCSLKDINDTQNKILNASNTLALQIAADVMIEFTTSKVAKTSIAPQLKRDLKYLSSKYSSSSLNDIVTTPTQIKIVAAAIDSLLKHGHFPNIKKGGEIKKRLAMELALNPSEIDYAALSEDLETYQDLFERLTLNPETKAHGMVIQTFLNNWSR